MRATDKKCSLNATGKMAYCEGLIIVLVMLCMLPIPTQPQTVGTAQNSPAPLGKLVDVGGYRVHLYCVGTGSPTVVIVGAGFSFNWGLVQPEVARFTQVCSYDHSGIGWSDDGPKDSCSLRVSEVHSTLKNAGIKGPFVLVGHSLGGFVARLYAGRYPDEVAGIVFVDHALNSGVLQIEVQKSAAGEAPVSPPPIAPASPMLLTPGGGATGIEGDPNFSKLSSRDRELHLWATAQPRNQAALRTNRGLNPGCVADIDAIVKDNPHPLANKPLVDISTNEFRSPDYIKLQTELLSLSQNSKEIIAEKSGHFVIIDRPDVVIDAISRVVKSVRNNAKL